MDFVTQQRVIERELRRFREHLAETIDPEWPAAVRVLVRRLHARLFDPGLTIGDARRACGLRSGSFARSFKRACGTTMRRYVEERRMLAALRLMTFPGVELGAIGRAVGYASYRAFGRAFKRCFDRPPGCVRAQMNETEAAPAAVLEAAFQRGGGRAEDIRLPRSGQPGGKQPSGPHHRVATCGRIRKLARSRAYQCYGV